MVLLVAQVPRLLFLPATLTLLILGLPALNCSADTRADLFSLINQARIDAGLNPLTRDPQVDQLATEWAGVMAAKNIQKHRPLTKDLLNLHGWKNLSENIYGPVSGPVSAKTIFQAWMGSSGHRDNLLRESTTLGGLGIVTTPSGSVCAVFNGAKLAPPAPSSTTTSSSANTNDSEVAFPGIGLPDFIPKTMRDPAAALPSNSDGRKLNQLGRTNL